MTYAHLIYISRPKSAAAIGANRELLKGLAHLISAQNAILI